MKKHFLGGIAEDNAVVFPAVLVLVDSRLVNATPVPITSGFHALDHLLAQDEQKIDCSVVDFAVEALLGQIRIEVGYETVAVVVVVVVVAVNTVDHARSRIVGLLVGMKKVGTAGDIVY